MTRSVPLDDDVFEFVQNRAASLGEDYSSTLRWLLKIGREEMGIEPVAGQDLLPTSYVPQTSQDLFYFPVLESLAKLDERATAADVRVKVYEKMRHLLNTADLKQVNSGRGTRWEKQVGWAGHHLRHEGSIIKKITRYLAADRQWSPPNRVRKEAECQNPSRSLTTSTSMSKAKPSPSRMISILPYEGY